MTHTNSNIERTYKRKEEDYVPKDRKRDKARGKYLRARARRMKERVREIEE